MQFLMHPPLFIFPDRRAAKSFIVYFRREAPQKHLRLQRIFKSHYDAKSWITEREKLDFITIKKVESLGWKRLDIVTGQKLFTLICWNLDWKQNHQPKRGKILTTYHWYAPQQLEIQDASSYCLFFFFGSSNFNFV